MIFWVFHGIETSILISVYQWVPAALEKFSSALQWVMLSKYGAGGMSQIFFIGPPNSQQCHDDLLNFLSICEHIPIKKE